MRLSEGSSSAFSIWSASGGTRERQFGEHRRRDRRFSGLPASSHVRRGRIRCTRAREGCTGDNHRCYIKDRRDIPSPSARVARHRVTMPALVEAKVRLYETMRAAKVNKSELLARRLDWNPAGATGCKGPRHRWHSRQHLQFRICNLRNLKGRVGFESHALRFDQTAPAIV